MRTLEHHKKGVLSVAWCPQDSDLLLSAAKDNQVLCWNPNSDTPGGEVGGRGEGGGRGREEERRGGRRGAREGGRIGKERGRRGLERLWRGWK